MTSMLKKGLPPFIGAPWERESGEAGAWGEDPHTFTMAKHLRAKKEEFLSLIRQAEDFAENAEWESALWRAVNAAGILSFFANNPDAQGMPRNPTGRGYFVGEGRGYRGEGLR